MESSRCSRRSSEGRAESARASSRGGRAREAMSSANFTQFMHVCKICIRRDENGARVCVRRQNPERDEYDRALESCTKERVLKSVERAGRV